jgi:hypothetical protein
VYDTMKREEDIHRKGTKNAKKKRSGKKEKRIHRRDAEDTEKRVRREREKNKSFRRGTRSPAPIVTRSRGGRGEKQVVFP